MVNTYPMVNGTLAGQNLGYFFTYANSVTHQMFGVFMVISFFLVTLIGSSMAQLRLSGRLRPETSFLASSFVALIFAVILSQYNGIISPIVIFVLLGLTIICGIWVMLTGQD